jgi:adenylate kinase family enzyme
LGDALRTRAQVDTDLADLLSKGQLAPESVAIDLVRQAALESAESGLILDGFPRHSAQVRVCKSLFPIWAIMLLEIDPAQSVERLANRSSFSQRPEDSPEIIATRVATGGEMLDGLLKELGDLTVHRIDANLPSETVLRRACEIAEMVSAYSCN